jgi:RNA polymerase sigma-70 factor (ECF subfamily)
MDQRDRTQLEHVRKHDERGLASLYDCHSRLVYSVALAILRNQPSAEDVLQDVFLQIWRNPEKFLAVKGDLSAWLAVVTRNRCIDQLRQLNRTISMEELVLASPFDLAHTTEHELMYRHARNLIADLTLDQQTVLRLVFDQNLSHREISRLTGCPLGTIKSRIRSSLIYLKKGFDIQQM